MLAASNNDLGKSVVDLDGLNISEVYGQNTPPTIDSLLQQDSKLQNERSKKFFANRSQHAGLGSSP